MRFSSSDGDRYVLLALLALFHHNGMNPDFFGDVGEDASSSTSSPDTFIYSAEVEQSDSQGVIESLHVFHA